MMKQRADIVIPACKVDANFRDDMLLKVGDRSILESAIHVALKVVERERITVVTDSDEIESIILSLDIKVHRLQNGGFLKRLDTILANYKSQLPDGAYLIILPPYIWNITPEDLLNALTEFISLDCDYAFAVTSINVPQIPKKNDLSMIFSPLKKEVPSLVKGLLFLRKNCSENMGFKQIELAANCHVVSTIEDFWTIERRSRRKQIIFRVVGNLEIGSGHVHRALAVAKMLVGHDITFVCGQRDKLVVDTLADYQYPTLVVENSDFIEFIKEKTPHLLISDVLEIDEQVAKSLRELSIRHIAFETFGKANEYADCVINEIKQITTAKGNHIYTGTEYALLREEVLNQKRTREPRVPPKEILLTFGGTDPKNYTCLTLSLIDDLVVKLEARVTVVIGRGFGKNQELAKILDVLKCKDLVSLVYDTDNIAKLMSKADFAVCSNGRTVFELAHMSVPSVILCQNERELDHDFSHGLEGLSLFGMLTSEQQKYEFRNLLIEILFDTTRLTDMGKSLSDINFRGGREKVMKLINRHLFEQAS